MDIFQNKPESQPPILYDKISTGLMVAGGVPFAAFVVNQVAEASGYGDLAVFIWLIEFSQLPPDHLKNLFAIPAVLLVVGAAMGFRRPPSLLG